MTYGTDQAPSTHPVILAHLPWAGWVIDVSTTGPAATAQASVARPAAAGTASRR